MSVTITWGVTGFCSELPGGFERKCLKIGDGSAATNCEKTGRYRFFTIRHSQVTNYPKAISCKYFDRTSVYKYS